MINLKNYTDDIPLDGKTIKCSTTDPESGWFRKENTSMCLHMGLTACDKNGWIIDFTVNPGNEHDSKNKGLYDKLTHVGMKYCADAGYKNSCDSENAYRRWRDTDSHFHTNAR